MQMGKNILIIVSTVLVIVLGYIFFSFSKTNSTQKTLVTNKTSTTVASSVPTTKNLNKAGNYINFTNDDLSAYKGKKIVLFFYANWCPTCKPINEDLISKGLTLDKDVVVIRVNYNDSDTDKSEEALANKYGVTYQHTFVYIDGDGTVINKWNGGGIAEINSNTK